MEQAYQSGYIKQLLNKIHSLEKLKMDNVIEKDPIILAVIADLDKRSQIGIKKYGRTLAREDLGLKDWLQHAYEECLDQANYLKRSIIELEKKTVINKTQ